MAQGQETWSNGKVILGSGDALGVAGAGFTAVESAAAGRHMTTLTIDGTFGAIAGGAALALGIPAYTLPAGALLVHGAYMSVVLTAEDGNIDADTPDVGVGTTAGSGANALLSAVGVGAENIITGQTAANCSGTATVKTVSPTAGTSLGIEAADSHVVYLNIADTWAASGEAALPVTGLLVLEWSKLA